MSMIVCPHPSRCGVQRHIAGSQSARECVSTGSRPVSQALPPRAAAPLSPMASTIQEVLSAEESGEWSGRIALVLHDEHGFRPQDESGDTMRALWMEAEDMESDWESTGHKSYAEALAAKLEAEGWRFES